jgi:hypothetical protein
MKRMKNATMVLKNAMCESRDFPSFIDVILTTINQRFYIYTAVVVSDKGKPVVKLGRKASGLMR